MWSPIYRSNEPFYDLSAKEICNQPLTKVYSQTLHGDNFAHSSMSLNLNFVFHLPSNHFTKSNSKSRGLFPKGCNETGLQRIFVCLVMQNELENIFTNIYKFPPTYSTKHAHLILPFKCFFFFFFQGTFSFLKFIYFFSFLFLFFFSHIYTRLPKNFQSYQKHLILLSKPTKWYIICIPIIPPKHINIFPQLKGKDKTFT